MEIWKFNLTELGNKFLMPIGAKILSLQVQEHKGDPCIWAAVDPDALKEAVKFITIGTGHKVPGHISIPRDFVRTYQMSDGHLIWHVFKVN